MNEELFMFLLYLADTPYWLKEVLEEVLNDEREEDRINRLLTVTSHL